MHDEQDARDDALRGPDEGTFFDAPGEAGTGRDATTSPHAQPDDPDAGFFGVDSGDEESDNAARQTTPGYQSDKWDRGTIMPR